MSSSIFFKFKSQKEPMQITFDGTSLSVFEVKREIIAIARLGDGTDFDLEISTPETGEKYDDDTTQIPRSTTVIARRTPAQKPGAGRAARYVTGKMPITAKNQHRGEATSRAAPGASMSTTIVAAQAEREMTEEERLNAMFAADSGSWKAEQSQMSHKPIVRSTFNKPTAVPDKPPPTGYTCFRCGQKGHWIQACPTNTDPNWDRRFKKTTGIPSSMLHKVEKILDDDGKPDFSKLPAGVMVNANGDWMVAAPDKAAWDKFQEKQNAAAEKAKDVIADNEELRERGLECSIDSRLFNDPVKTPCCGQTYCRDCIETALLDGDLLCPHCAEQVLLDKLEVDHEMVAKIQAYESEKKAERGNRGQDAAQSPSAVSASTPNNASGSSPAAASPSLSVVQPETNGSKSPIGSPNARKRPAEDELEHNHTPPGPSEMQASSAKPDAASKPTASVPTGPKAMQQPPQQQPAMPAVPGNMRDFAQQMNAMSGGMGMMPNGMMNPMMGMPGMGPMMGMPGMMNPMNSMPMPMPMGFPGNFGPMGGMPGMFGGGWANNGAGAGAGWNGGNNHNNNNNMMNNGNGQANGAGDGAYFRQPVNPHRQQARQRRQRSVDYKQM